MRIAIFFAPSILYLALMVASSHAAISGVEPVASDLNAPIYVTHAPGDRERLFIVQRGGAIRILNLNSGALEPVPFLSIPGVDTAGEGGLLGMAFHPDYANNGKFYVNVTIDNGGQDFQGAESPFSTHIRQYTASANPNIANPTPTEILTFLQPQANHNAGWIGFNPAITPGQPQYLYIPTGDGGGRNDHDSDGDEDGHTPGIGNAQDPTENLLGKILRIDVDGDDFPADVNRNYRIPPDNPFKAGVGAPGDDGGDDEIWALGFRNPFRDSFDRLTGDLWLGDVGQSSREEIDRLPANSTGAENFGWRLREGFIETPDVGGDKPPGNVDPVFDYDRSNDQDGGVLVTGGYVYRGPDPSLQGKYFFLDSRNSPETTDDNYWMFDPANPAGTVENIDDLLIPAVDPPQFPVSFGEDAVGNLYIAYLISGDVYRIATNELLAGDYDADGEVDDEDRLAWRAAFGSTGAGLAADGNGNGVIDAADYVVWRENQGMSVHAAAAAGSVTVPEPATILDGFQLMAVLVIGSLLRIRSRRGAPS
jgi:glucose/arabinose dehydrogenase